MLRSLVHSSLAFLLLMGTLVAQEALGPSSHVPHHRKTAKGRTSVAVPVDSATRVEVYNGAKAQTQVFTVQQVNSMKRGSKVSPALTRVDVYNGSSKQMQVFSAEPTSGPNAAKSAAHIHDAQRNVATAHSISDVEIFNGTTKERKIFTGAADNSNATMPTHQSGQPLVVGIASNGSDDEAKSATRVVTGIASSGSRAESSTDLPVAVGISPIPPKRPQYIPVPPL